MAFLGQNYCKLAGNIVDIDCFEKHQYHATSGAGVGKHPGLIDSLSDEELAFCNFCYSMKNAANYKFQIDSDGQRKPISKMKDKNVQNAYFRMLVEAVEREVFSWIEIDPQSKSKKIRIPQNGQMFGDILGCYYTQVADFVLLLHGYKRKNSTISARIDNNSVYGVQELQETPECELKDLMESVDKKIDKSTKKDPEM